MNADLRPSLGRIRIVQAEPRRRSHPILAAGLGACVGAAVTYLLDPDRGRSRRARVRDKGAHATHEVRDGLGVLGRDLSNRGRGSAAAARYRLTGSSADDRILHERVRAELGRHVTHPHAVEVEVQDRVVTLTGDVLLGEDERACRMLRRIPGVKHVDTHWNVHRDAGDVPRLQGHGRRRKAVPELRQQRWSPTTRLLAGGAGASLWAMSRRLPRPVSWLAGCAAFALAARAATNLPLRRLTGVNAGREAVEVTAAVSIAAPLQAVWPLVSDYSLFPRFMPDVEEVRLSADELRSHWVVRGPAGTRIRFTATETKREEGAEIAWKSTEGQLIAHTGVLRVDGQSDGRTRVQVHLCYNPIAGAAGHAIASLLGSHPQRKLRQDLMRLKEHVETQVQPVSPTLL
ncbi:MAG: BON domain-containing protein [Nonomuraea sp.]|nr:BON domain-containing protein [Nonomuraea sp.]